MLLLPQCLLCRSALLLCKRPLRFTGHLEDARLVSDL
jgi:hypothetical protein